MTKIINRIQALNFLSSFEIILADRDELLNTLESDYLDDNGESIEYVDFCSYEVQLFLINFYSEEVNRGVTNEFLLSFLQKNGLEGVQIEGEEEPLYVCSCCGCKSLPDRYEYSICRVCFWEDSGDYEPNSDQHSSCNRMSIKTGRMNFKKFGACSERSLEFVDPLGKEKFRQEIEFLENNEFF